MAAQKDCGNVGIWNYIPIQAFLYFPKQNEIIQQKNGKIRRFIAESGSPFTQLEQLHIKNLQQLIKSKSLVLSPWFTKANKLRILQRNQFQQKKAVEEIEKISSWRQRILQFKNKQKSIQALQNGCIYFCGRDKRYRPILVLHADRFQNQDAENAQEILAIVFEFIIESLLIEGQVEQFVVFINMNKAKENLAQKIIKSFTLVNNYYGDRLYLGYINYGSSNIEGICKEALKDILSYEQRFIQIKGRQTFEMYAHINKKNIEYSFGGVLEVQSTFVWPPNEQQLTTKDQQAQKQADLLSLAMMKNFYQSGKLKGHKVSKVLIQLANKEQTLIKNNGAGENSQQNHQFSGVRQQSIVSVDFNDFDPLKQIIVKGEVSFIKKYQTITTFFTKEQFVKITDKIKRYDD